jgi:hypothetical protein
MSMSPAFLSAVQERNPPIVPIVTIEWPTLNGGTKHYTSESFQYFDPRIPDAGIGNVTTSVSERPSDLTFQTLQIALNDYDGTVSSILYGKVDPRRSHITLRWAHPNLSETDWFTIFTGIVHDWSWQSGIVELNCKTDDTALYGLCPKAMLLPGTIPGLISAARGLCPAIIYGIWDDQSLEGKGSIPCQNITLDATSGYQYMVGIGVLKSLPRVYLNGVVKTLTSDYTIINPNWGGTVYTVIRFVAATTETDEVAADVEGLTTVGTGGGGLITSGIQQLKHFLVNFGWGDWRSGAWFADTAAPIDTDAFASADTFISKFGSEGSIYEGGSLEQIRVIDVINRWLKSQPMLRPRWSNNGTLGLRHIDHATRDYVSAPWIQQERDELRPMKYDTIAGQIISNVSINYLPGRRAGKLWQSLNLQDLKLWTNEKVTEQLQFENSAARFQ